jgi:hypothetical protein
VPHRSADVLDDLADVLAEVRTWAGVAETKPGVFYVGRDPFLHFHLVHGGQRRADIKAGSEWIQVFVPRPASRMLRRALLTRLRECWAEKQ